MIVVETKKIDGIEYKYTYSDEDYMIRKIGTDEIYTEAIDKLDSNYTYEETDELINNEEIVVESEV